MFVKLLIVLVAGALALGIVARTSHGAGPERSYVVKPTDTLWSIAAKTYGGDTREGVWQLMQRNRLRSTTLLPGQALVLAGR